MGSARVERDNNDFLEILTWFRNHNPFTTSEKLVCLDSGFIDENNTVNCDKAELIGARIQKSLNNQTFASRSFKRKDQITNLQRLYPSIMIDKERVATDPLTRFLRLVVLVDRKPEVEIENCFYYELTPYPTGLFKDGVMRAAKNKSTLKTFLLEGVKPTENTESEIVADGGALLWLCNWRKGEKFRKIFDLYIDKCRKFNINTVVFDGYNKLTKERSNKMSWVVETSDGNDCLQIEQRFRQTTLIKKSLSIYWHAS